MTDRLSLMCILAHPDDESLGMGPSLVKYGREGVALSVVCATRGERGRFFDNANRPDQATVGQTREQELRAASEVLGVDQVYVLNYIDGDLDQAPPQEAVAMIVTCIRAERPQVVTTFGPDGGYGHPDHIAISQFAGAAIVCAADPSYTGYADLAVTSPPHRVSKFYYMAWTEPQWRAYQSAFKDLKTTIDGVERRATPFPDWAVTTRVDTSDCLETVWKAVQCHKTQLAIYRKLDQLSTDDLHSIFGVQEFYRVLSTVNGGRKVETDLFEGIRT
jgi:LmbE family N-acetylglucosaminyl deacetylase